MAGSFRPETLKLKIERIIGYYTDGRVEEIETLPPPLDKNTTVWIRPRTPEGDGVKSNIRRRVVDTSQVSNQGIVDDYWIEVYGGRWPFKRGNINLVSRSNI